MFNFLKNLLPKSTKTPPIQTLRLESASKAPYDVRNLHGAYKAERAFPFSTRSTAMFPVQEHTQTGLELWEMWLEMVTEAIGLGELVPVSYSVKREREIPSDEYEAEDMEEEEAEAALKPEMLPYFSESCTYVTKCETVYVSVSVEFGNQLRDTDVQYSNVDVHINGYDEDMLRKVASLADPLYVPVTYPKKLSVNFWMMGPYGPDATTRRLDVPGWDEIKDAYPSDVREAASAVMTKPKRGTGVMLWHGPPGTGKTTAIRSLMQEWAEWGAQVQLVSDPEKLLSDANYLNSVMSYAMRSGGNDAPPILIVLEDSGELITSDAKTNAGQALSRLLNMTDGILGQNENVYVLITTNEPLTSLHDAVTRPGRCISNIDFHKLTATDIQEWCEKNEVDYDEQYQALEAATLAELYAIKDDFLVVTNIEVTAGIATERDEQKERAVELMALAEQLVAEAQASTDVPIAMAPEHSAPTEDASSSDSE